MSQLLKLQDLLFQDGSDPEMDGKARAMVTRAWKELQELKLRLQMKPAPKPIDVSQGKPRRKRVADQALAPMPALPTPPVVSQPPPTA